MFKIPSISWLVGSVPFFFPVGNDLPSECPEYQPQTQAGSQGASPRWAELVSHSGHLYARPIPIAELEKINFPPPATAALAHTPQALPPTKVGATLGPLLPPPPPAPLRGARPAGGQQAAGPGLGRRGSPGPRHPGPLTCSRESHAPAGCGLGLPLAPPPLPPPGLNPPGDAASGPPRPAPPRAGDPGAPASGPVLGAPDSGPWSGGASPWRPRASPGPGSF